MLVDLWSERVRLPAGSMSCFLKQRGRRRPGLHPFNPERPEGGQSPPSALRHLLAQDSFVKTEPVGPVRFTLRPLMFFRCTSKHTLGPFMLVFHVLHISDLCFFSCRSPVGQPHTINHTKNSVGLTELHISPVVPHPAGKGNVQIGASRQVGSLSSLDQKDRNPAFQAHVCTLRVATHNEIGTSGPRLIKAPTPWPNTED